MSEFAGAAQSLNGSIVVNPWDSQQVADAIHEAVTMDAGTRAENHRKLFKYVNKYSAAFWGMSFIKEMEKIDLAEGGAGARREPESVAKTKEQAVLRPKADDPALTGDGSALVDVVPPTQVV